MSLDTARWQEAVRLWWEDNADDLAGAARATGARNVYALLAASALEPLIAQVGLEDLPTALPDRFTERDTRLLDVVVKGAGKRSAHYLVRESSDPTRPHAHPRPHARSTSRTRSPYPARSPSATGGC
ncbi:MAG: hypothetical protein P8Z40_07985 [Chloroflexota bacterium]